MFRLVGILVAVALIAGVYFLSSEPGESTAPAAAGPPAEAPGYAAKNAEVVETGDDGRPLYTLTAVQVRQHPNDNRIQLDAPRMTYIASDGQPWHVRARSGQIREGGEHVELFGDVHLNGNMPGAEAPTVVDTSVLSFNTKTEIVSTKAPLTLDWGGRKIAATGMTVNLNDHTVKLESRINGRLPAQ
jgi:lipopolysaccharide export system protein LptC